MLDNEIYWNNPPIYEYNIMQYTLNYRLLGEHGDREWVNNRGEEVNLIKEWYIHSTKVNTTWTINIHLIKKYQGEGKSK
jgi:hypothetical protein